MLIAVEPIAIRGSNLSLIYVGGLRHDSDRAPKLSSSLGKNSAQQQVHWQINDNRNGEH